MWWASLGRWFLSGKNWLFLLGVAGILALQWQSHQLLNAERDKANVNRVMVDHSRDAVKWDDNRDEREDAEVDAYEHSKAEHGGVVCTGDDAARERLQRVQAFTR